MSVYELDKFVRKYKPKTIELNVFQLEDIYSKLFGFPFKPSFKEYLEEYRMLTFNGIKVYLI